MQPDFNPANSIHLLWAKYDGEMYHPLLWHMLDAAAAARRLWEDGLGVGVRCRLANGLRLDEDAAGHWITFLVGLHDLGKASQAFQGKSDLLAARLRGQGIPWNPAAAQGPHHGLVTAATLPEVLCGNSPSLPLVDPATTAWLAQILGGHHGIFPTADVIADTTCKLAAAEHRSDSWRRLRRELAEHLAVMHQVLDADTPLIDPFTPDNPAAMLLAGLTVIADWIASNQDFFPFHAEVKDPAQYFILAQAQAGQALSRLGWCCWQPPEAIRGFMELFPDVGSMMRPVQLKVDDMARQEQMPRLVVIEVPMGEGKTEAAMLLQDGWCGRLQQRGAYFALPTMATSNQMFTRIENFIQAAYPANRTNLHLLHSHALLSDEYQKLRIRAVDQDGKEEGAVIANEWFMQRKRGLLAPFAVGTIDQTLLAVLQTRHGFLRLTGLAEKTIIFDEVHAYDTYMLTLFEQLLAWLARLGSTVVILSATLPRERLARLTAAWGCTDCGTGPAPYPRISSVTAAGEFNSQSVDAARHSRIGLEWVAEETLTGDLASRLAEGGCVAWICNTVGRAQQVYMRLKDALAGLEIEVDLFHARYPFEQRDLREKRSLRKFGKGGERPRRAILVATQVIEQSLDLDFDLMVTDLAPADLILQRSGRLQRHERPRPGPLAQPRLILLKPQGHDAGAPDFGRSVYDEWILLRSWLGLRKRAEIIVPDDVEGLIEAVYGSLNPETLGSPMAARLEEARLTHEERQRLEQIQARTVRLGSPGAEGLLDAWNRDLDEDNPDAPPMLQALTRLSGPTVAIVCLHRVAGGIFFDPAGHRVCDLTVEPGLALAKRLLLSAVSLSYGGCTRDFPAEECPPSWRRSPLLRHHRLAIFENGRLQTAGRTRLDLDPELGIVITRKPCEGGENESVVQSDQ